MNWDIKLFFYFFNPTQIYLISTCVDTVLGIQWDMKKFKEMDPNHKSLGMKTNKHAQWN